MTLDTDSGYFPVKYSCISGLAAMKCAHSSTQVSVGSKPFNLKTFFDSGFTCREPDIENPVRIVSVESEHHIRAAVEARAYSGLLDHLCR